MLPDDKGNGVTLGLPVKTTVFLIKVQGLSQ
jgi:hypothetical protein